MDKEKEREVTRVICDGMEVGGVESSSWNESCNCETTTPADHTCRAYWTAENFNGCSNLYTPGRLTWSSFISIMQSKDSEENGLTEPQPIGTHTKV